MFWTDRSNKLAGVVLVLAAAFIVINIVLSVAVAGDADPINRGDIEGLLQDIADHQGLYFLEVASSIATDAVLLLGAATVLYLAFRDRSHALALFGFAALMGGGIAYMAEDAASLTLGVLAIDFVEKGGPGGIPVGDPAILESARAVALIGGLADPVASTAVGFGLMALGWLLVWAPAGAVNPPRWMGAIAAISGLGLTTQWLLYGPEALGLVTTTVGYFGTILWFFVLGGWLVVQDDRQPAPAMARPAPSPA